MRVLIVSDTHGDEYALRHAIAYQPQAKLVIHLGDGAREVLDLTDEYPDRRLLPIAGNCDYGYSAVLPDSGIETVAGYRIFFTHGHRYGVKMGLYKVCCAAREKDCQILLFGHTHMPLTEYEDGLYIMNPGSLAGHRPTYGILDITQAGIVTNIMELGL
ncbi:MAG TPA: metallophosphoesterase [Ruminococcaceae bacterium]|nr:metallophosphoesterase [Oscillospiraceae bacterium]